MTIKAYGAQVTRQGLAADIDEAAVRKNLNDVAAQRWAEVDGAGRAMGLEPPRCSPPVLFITGDQAHSRIFSEHAYKRASEPKELFIVPGAGHVDLYDRVNLSPWEKLNSFFTTALAMSEDTEHAMTTGRRVGDGG